MSKESAGQRLSRMALDVLSIPAMNDEPKRVFSGARRTVSWDRAQMSAETLERLECLKHWKRNGILNRLLTLLLAFFPRCFMAYDQRKEPIR